MQSWVGDRQRGLVAALLMAFSSAGFCQAPEPVELLREKLALYASPRNLLTEAERHLAALDSDDYLQRRKAKAFLIHATGLNELLLESLERASTVERQMALRVILAAQKASDTEEKLRLLMRRITMDEVKGLAGAILDAWEGRRATNDDTRRLSRAAILATLEEGDLERLREGLGSATPLVRELALLGMQHLARGEELIGLLQPLLADENEAVQLHAAILLAAREERVCLQTLVSLLDSETFYIRRQSHEVLTAITDQDFGFYSDGVLIERQAAARLWQRWLAKFGEKAPLRWEKAREWFEGGEDVLE